MSLNPVTSHVSISPSRASEEFNEEASDHLALSGGMLAYSDKDVDWQGQRSIYIQKRVSRKPGFGTASTRYLFKRSLELGFQGRLFNQASWSSHYFHVLQEFIPCDRQINYMDYRWGEQAGRNALEDLNEIQEELSSGKAPKNRLSFRILKEMLSEVRGVPLDAITNEMIRDVQSEEFDTLEKREVSYTHYVFIPSILKALEKAPLYAQPNTSSLCSVNMMLSQSGIDRWNDAVRHKKPFQPCYELEQFALTLAQKEQIHLLVILRKTASSIQKYLQHLMNQDGVPAIILDYIGRDIPVAS